MMNSECDKMKERILDLITGILPEGAGSAVRQHIAECAVCRGYAEALKAEDELLSGLFAKLDSRMPGLEEDVISRIERVDVSSRRMVRVGRRIAEASLARRAAAAAVIVAVAMYFVLTLTWISQIQQYIRLSEEYIRAGM
ncbi:MAG: anti-sigma factor family protein [Planctomycetota bacterium]|jgi:anti-sigma factor RsiW